MVQVSIVDMKAKLSTYVDRAARGEQILICRHNKPVAELRPVSAVRSEPRPVGPLPGRPTFDVPASFFEPMEHDELDRWDAVSPSDPLSSLSTGRPPAATRNRKGAGRKARARVRKQR